MAKNILTFGQLSAANQKRAQIFPNKHGVAVHQHVEWNRAEWLEAMVGELGEYCNDSKKHRRGDLTVDEFYAKAIQEIGGTLLYLDLMCAQIARETGRDFTLGFAACAEFNRKSKQLGLPLFIAANGNLIELTPDRVEGAEAMPRIPGVDYL